MVFLQERIGKLCSEMQKLIYPNAITIEDYKTTITKERTPINEIDVSSWSDFKFGQICGGHNEYFWFATEVEIPADFDGKTVTYELNTGSAGLWDTTNPQLRIYINGKFIQGLDENHREVIVCEQAKAGDKYQIVLCAFTGVQTFQMVLHSQLKVLDRKAEKYYYDLSVPYNVSLLLPSQEKAYIDIITALNESVNLLDLRKPFSAEYYASLEKAQAYLDTEFYGKLCGKNVESKVYCVGHTHIDCAWLWTLAVTEDKAVRSFSTVIELMKQFPEYIFMSSQPLLYKFVKKNAPELYEQIKQRINEGQWEPDGAMFVEADCNLSSGEALVRQVLFGKRFFMQEFNKDNKILWLPDVFGYSAALPQIMQKSGLPYFMTTKISWNEFNKLPYDTFMWEGIDGTKVLTHFIPARDYEKIESHDEYHASHFTTYNGMLEPNQVKGGWQRYQQKHITDEVMMCFGYGDGGGGPTKEMLENARRMSAGIPGCPQVVMSTARNYFETIEEEVKDNKYLPTWSGELYLEYHRGTYTSMARNKKFNRKSEFAYQNTELYSMMNRNLNGAAYPQDKINDGWEVLLKNQFHDILPGSSIKEVYEDSREEYKEILAQSSAMIAQALDELTASVSVPANSLVVYNPNGFENNEVVTFTAPEGMTNVSVYDGDKKLNAQKLSDGSYLFKAMGVPSKGYKSFTLKDEASDAAADVISKDLIENKFFKITINEKGQFSSIFDKTAGREVLKAGECGNVIMTYEDKPHNWDAWDVNNYYKEKSWEVNDVKAIEVVEQGPVVSVLKVSYAYLDSTLDEYIYVYNDVARIDIKYHIDWKEHHIFVKTLFPIDVHTTEATFDIQYGNVKRATHYNTSWDFARFEVCFHKWLDVSEDDYGVSFLSECKYGCSVHDGVVGLSMLKSAMHPNPDADKEVHDFTFSIYPHAGDWKDAKTVEEAYKLNNPMTAVVKTTEGGDKPASYSAVATGAENVMVEVVKKAEDSDAMIVRMYECYNRRTNTTMTFPAEIASIQECDLMENEIGEVAYSGNAAEFSIKPYEIKTFKVTLK